MCLCFLLALTQEEKSWSLCLQGWDNVNKEEFWVGVSLRQEGSPPLPGQTIPKEWNNVSSRKSRKKKKNGDEIWWLNELRFKVKKWRASTMMALEAECWHFSKSVDISKSVPDFWVHNKVLFTKQRGDRGWGQLKGGREEGTVRLHSK